MAVGALLALVIALYAAAYARGPLENWRLPYVEHPEGRGRHGTGSPTTLSSVRVVSITDWIVEETRSSADVVGRERGAGHVAQVSALITTTDRVDLPEHLPHLERGASVDFPRVVEGAEVCVFLLSVSGRVSQENGSWVTYKTWEVPQGPEELPGKFKLSHWLTDLCHTADRANVIRFTVGGGHVAACLESSVRGLEQGNVVTAECSWDTAFGLLGFTPWGVPPRRDIRIRYIFAMTT